MIRRAVTGMLASLCCAASVTSQAPVVLPRPAAPDRVYEGDTLRIRAEGRGERSVLIVKITIYKDGESLADLQDVETGARYTVPGKVLANMARQAVIVRGAPRATTATPKLDKLPLPAVPTLPGSATPSPIQQSQHIDPLAPLTKVAPPAPAKPEPKPIKPDPEEVPQPLAVLPPVRIAEPQPIVVAALPPMPVPSTPIQPEPLKPPPLEPVKPPPTEVFVGVKPVKIVPPPMPIVGEAAQVKSSAEYPKYLPPKRVSPEICDPPAVPVPQPMPSVPVIPAPAPVPVTSKPVEAAPVPVKPAPAPAPVPAPVAPAPVEPEGVRPSVKPLNLPGAAKTAERLAKQSITIDHPSKLKPPAWSPPQPIEVAPDPKKVPEGIQPSKKNLTLQGSATTAERLAKQPIIVDHQSKLTPPVWSNTPKNVEPEKPEPPVRVPTAKLNLPLDQKLPSGPFVIEPSKVPPPDFTRIPEIKDDPPVVTTPPAPVIVVPMPAPVPEVKAPAPVVQTPVAAPVVAKPARPKPVDESQARREAMAAVLARKPKYELPPEPKPLIALKNGPALNPGDRLGTETTEQVKELFTALRPSVRERAATNLAECRYNWRPEVKGVLAQAALRDPAPTVRSHCIKLLSQLGYSDSEYVRALEVLAATDEPVVRQAAETALGKLMPSKP